MDFYQDFTKNKKENKLTNADIAEKIDLSPDALRMAVKRKGLSKLQINEIEKMFAFKKISEQNSSTEIINIDVELKNIDENNLNFVSEPEEKYIRRVPESELLKQIKFKDEQIEFYKNKIEFLEVKLFEFEKKQKKQNGTH